MSRLYPVHWKTFEKFLFKVGCHFVNQQGSHRKYTKPGMSRPVILTVHGAAMIPKMHIKSNLKTLGVTLEEYLRTLDDL